MPLVSVASDTFLEATPPVDLDLHVPTSFPAITGWDYGDPTGEWTIENPPPFRAQRQSGAGAYVRSRNDITTVDFNGPFTVISDIVRGAVDDTLSDGLVGFFLMTSTRS